MSGETSSPLGDGFVGGKLGGSGLLPADGFAEERFGGCSGERDRERDLERLESSASEESDDDDDEELEGGRGCLAEEEAELETGRGFFGTGTGRGDEEAENRLGGL